MFIEWLRTIETNKNKIKVFSCILMNVSNEYFIFDAWDSDNTDSIRVKEEVKTFTTS